MLVAHRVAWELKNGPIPDGLCVCHRCDNPPCVNPEHLFLGTRTDNMADKIRKGRGARGETHGRAKLTAKQVEQIRSLLSRSSLTQREIAQIFNVGDDTVSQIHRGISWVQKS